MEKYHPTELSNFPYQHRHLWEEYTDKDKKSGKPIIIEKCKFCKIIRNKK